MGRTSKNKLGKHAVVSVPWRFVRPLIRVKEAHPNDYHTTRGEFEVTGIDYECSIDGKTAVCAILSCAAMPDCELYCRLGNLKLVRPGPPNHYFSNNPSTKANQGARNAADGPHVPEQPGQQNDQNAQSDVESDGEEAEVQPQPVHGVIWDENFQDYITVDARSALGATKHKSKMNKFSHIDVQYIDPFTLLRQMLPLQYIIDHVIPATNKELALSSHLQLTVDEFWLWLALHMIMSLNQSYTQREFFAKGPRTVVWNPPYLGDYMSRNRFEQINTHLRLTNSEAPTDHRDKFWEIRDLYKAFNDNMSEVFTPCWIVCVDESMVIFTNPNCPGWVTVKRKPHPFGNEVHTTACADSKILFYIEIVEGKDQPKEGPYSNKKFEEAGRNKTAALVLRATESMHGTGRVVALDSGFGGIPAIVELKKHGLFSTCVIKKKRYWPANTDGDKAVAEMQGKDVGTIRVRKGQKDDVHFYLAAMADSKHTSLMLSSCHTTKLTGNPRKRRVGNTLVEICHAEYAMYYYYARHCVDDNNNRRQGHLSFEESFNPKRWDQRQFGYVIGTATTNAELAYNHYVLPKKGQTPLSSANFRRELSTCMLEYCKNRQVGSMYESCSPEGSKSAKRARLGGSSHKLLKLETGKGPWTGVDWKKPSQPYQKYKCRYEGCKNLIRTYCACDKALMICLNCYIKHSQE